MKVAVVQSRPVWLDKKATTAKVIKLLEECGRRGGGRRGVPRNVSGRVPILGLPDERRRVQRSCPEARVRAVRRGGRGGRRPGAPAHSRSSGGPGHIRLPRHNRAG